MHLLDGGCIKLETQFTVGKRERRRDGERERKCVGVCACVCVCVCERERERERKRRLEASLVGNKNSRNHTYLHTASMWAICSVARRERLASA